MIRPFLERGLAEAGIVLAEGCYRSFEIFADELKKWNRKFNLTAISGDDEIAVKHIIDSLAVSAFIREDDCLLDIGSGAGLPALPLKIVHPGIRIVSVDAVGKKINFQRHVARLLKFNDFEARHCRVESLNSVYADHFDLIVSRAFSNLEMFVALAAPLLAKGGRIIAMKGPSVHNEVEDTAEKLCLMGFEISSTQEYSLPLNMGRRNLVTISEIKARE